VKQQPLANHCISELKCVPVKFFSIIIRQMAAASEEAIFSSGLLEEDGLSDEVDGLVDEADAAWALAVSVSVSAYWSISPRSPPPSRYAREVHAVRAEVAFERAESGVIELRIEAHGEQLIADDCIRAARIFFGTTV
jgi:hypothetical protein